MNVFEVSAKAASFPNFFLYPIASTARLTPHHQDGKHLAIGFSGVYVLGAIAPARNPQYLPSQKYLELRFRFKLSHFLNISHDRSLSFNKITNYRYSQNLVVYGDAKWGIDAYQNGPADSVSFQAGAGLKF